MVTYIGGNTSLIEMSQDDVDSLLAGVTTDGESYLSPKELDALMDGVSTEVITPNGKQQHPKISHSLEQLSHFRCGSCNGWWSIGDWRVKSKDLNHLYCTWCGEKQEVAQ